MCVHIDQVAHVRSYRPGCACAFVSTRLRMCVHIDQVAHVRSYRPGCACAFILTRLRMCVHINQVAHVRSYRPSCATKNKTFAKCKHYKFGKPHLKFQVSKFAKSRVSRFENKLQSMILNMWSLAHKVYGSMGVLGDERMGQ